MVSSSTQPEVSSARTPFVKPDFPPKLNAANWEIRLLILSPAVEHTAPLIGSFKVVSLHEHARYDAISHAWGMPGPSWLIEVDGRRYYITLSLAKCLVALRHISGSRALWVDAICVDQRSVQERSQQVGFMQHTFSGARCVQVWLGHKSTRCKRLVLSVDHFARRTLATPAGRPQQQQTVEEIDDLDLFFSEPQYWNRLWIWQELALARDIELVYGRISMSMNSFRSYLSSHISVNYNDIDVVDPRDKYNAHLSRMKQLNDMTQALDGINSLSCEGKMTKLIWIFAQARKTVASEAKDRVYGLLGICTAMFGANFVTADYAASLVDIYTNFAYRTIELSGGLGIFNQAIPAFNSIIGLPSWVPDWSSFYDARYESERLMIGNSHGGRVDLLKTDAKLQIQNKPVRSIRLTISGVICGTVATVGIPCQPNEAQRVIQSHIMAVIETWYQTAKEVWHRTIKDPPARDLQTFLTNDSLVASRFAVTMLRGQSHIGGGFNQATHPRAALLAFVQNPTCEVIYGRPELTHRVHQLRQAVIASRLLMMDDSEIGLGPVDTQPGDLLARLAGGRVPYILRKADNGATGAYSLVGECYVRAIMGDAADPTNRADRQEITLV